MIEVPHHIVVVDETADFRFVSIRYIFGAADPKVTRTERRTPHGPADVD